jgi:tRNA(fMet)-specific endonuclease VapC
MAGKFLLDTNIIIAVFANDPSVSDRLKRDDEVFVPSIALGEMFYGTFRSSRSVHNLQRLQDFMDALSILSCGAETARWYGKIKSTLRAKGRPLPENDIWIAAIAVQYDLAVATRDTFFREIAEIVGDEWR